MKIRGTNMKRKKDYQITEFCHRFLSDYIEEGGVISLCIYSGGDTGYEERDALLAYLRELDPRRWLVIACSYYNRKNDPPQPVFVIRM